MKNYIYNLTLPSLMTRTTRFQVHSCADEVVCVCFISLRSDKRSAPACNTVGAVAMTRYHCGLSLLSFYIDPLIGFVFIDLCVLITLQSYYFFICFNFFFYVVFCCFFFIVLFFLLFYNR